ncbi:MAG: hypothetical protein LBS57_12745 [Treponema sp.]|jgi:hypothetical protein|nr:hypothetical protein [Treponema sp.]
MRRRVVKIAVLCALCVIGAALNCFFNISIKQVVGIPLFLDTVMTMTLTFYGGAFWGLVTGILSNVIISSLWFYGWAYYLFALCNLAVALVTARFVRRFPRELSILPPAGNAVKTRRMEDVMERGVVLILLAMALCIVISVMGGLIALVVQIFHPGLPGVIDPELPFRAALIRRNFPSFAVEIGARILINIPDRLISAFAGYGIALLFGWVVRGFLRLKRG